MSDGINQYSVSDLFSGEADYLIPMYQRNYAWGEGEITQLIQDVLDEMPSHGENANDGKPYYIGTLVVFSKKQESGDRPVYEVIDGQQRLTTLHLLASYFRGQNDHRDGLLWFVRQCVRFESRPKSSSALRAIFEGMVEGKHAERFHEEEYNADIINGYELVKKLVPKLLKESNNVSPVAFAQYLFSRVQIMRVEVPEHTDLNHYFEIMNNRGEQLEKHEVLKSRLMSKLQESAVPENSQSLLACLNQVWEACSIMERYVQMGFTRGQRDSLFGKENWGQLMPTSFAELYQLLAHTHESSDSEQPLQLTDIIKPGLRQDIPSNKERRGEESPERFNTVVNFPNFLLQVLRVSTKEDVPLDDKRLISAFEKYVLRRDDAAERVKRFIFDLLRCKFLFDHYVIKREFTGNTDAWSLKRLKWQASNNSNDYVNTFGDEAADSDANRRVLMLLSALHVSTPTMVYKHWLNAAMHYLFHAGNGTYHGYLNYLESVTRCFVYDRFLACGAGLEYYDIIYRRMGVLKGSSWNDIDESKLRFGNVVNNLVFNYLDYLLWLEYREKSNRVRDYEFTFRSSVEHFYPQTPKEGHVRLSEDVLDSFGNLCLISHSKNSTLSNYMPEAKKDHYKAGALDSIKQWLIMQPEQWGEEEIKQHYDEMIGVFKADLAKGTAND